MVLETWCLGINDRVDSNTKVTYTFYNRIGMLLKSLVSVTRVTPAYQLSRKQGKDFMMCYKWVEICVLFYNLWVEICDFCRNFKFHVHQSKKLGCVSK